MQATINISLDVSKTKVRKPYAHDAICGIIKTNESDRKEEDPIRKRYAFDELRGFAKTDLTDEELLEEYLAEKYHLFDDESQDRETDDNTKLQTRIKSARKEHQKGNFVRCSNSEELQDFLDSL